MISDSNPKEDTNNYQGRIGLAWNVDGNGRDVVRLGYGRYYDVGYTNANILFAAVNATGIGAGQIFNVSNPNGIVKSNGTALPRRRRSVHDRLAERGRWRAAAELAHRVAAHPAALRRSVLGRLVASARCLDRGRHRLHPLGWARPRLASAAQSAQSRRRRHRAAPVRRPSDQPGQLHHRHQRRQEPVRWHQLRHPPPDDGRAAVLGVVFAVEGQVDDRATRPTSSTSRTSRTI